MVDQKSVVNYILVRFFGVTINALTKMVSLITIWSIILESVATEIDQICFISTF